MKKTLLLWIVLFLIAYDSTAQTYTEILSGWGSGRNGGKHVLIDLDNDDLLDLIVGNTNGCLYHYEQNSGSFTRFTLKSTNFDGIDVGNDADPFITDLDDDGLLELIVGEWDGNLNYYEQTEANSLHFALISSNFNGIDVEILSSPSIIDLDSDGLLDLIVGDGNGLLHHFEQVTVGSISFGLISDNFSGIDVDCGATPCFTDFNSDGLLDLVIGESSGRLRHYRQVSANSESFTLVSAYFNGIDAGDESSPSFVHLDNDGLLDLIVGEYEGAFSLYEQEAAGSDVFNIVTYDFCGINVGGVSSPCITDLDHDGLLDLIVGEGYGNLNHYEQEAVGSDYFTSISDNLTGSASGYCSAPCIVDLDDDGLLDLIVGVSEGNLNHYEQDAIGSLSFNFKSDNFNGISVGDGANPSITHFNNNDLLDLIIGEFDGNLNYYEQDAAGSNSFHFITANFNGIDVDCQSTPCFTDLDEDSLIDMIVGGRTGQGGGYLYHYEQDAAGSTTFTYISDHFAGIDVESPRPEFFDINGDGMDDLIVGEGGGGLHYFKRNEGPCLMDCFPSPGGIPFGLAWDGSYLWHSDQESYHIYQLDPSDGSTIFSFPSPVPDPAGLAWDGQHLWCSDQSGGVIYKIDTGSGLIISSFPSPEEAPFGLTWDGNYLWCAVTFLGRLYQLDPTDGAVIQYFEFSFWITGLTWDGASFWLTGTEPVTSGYKDLIYHISSTGDILTSYEPMGSAPTGLTWDGTFLWNCDCGTDMFYKIDVGFTTAVEEVAGVQIPEGFDLAQNYPNPFNPSTTIRYSLPQSSFVTLKIYNLLGKEIESLVSGQKPAGEYEIHWTTKDLPSGIYLYRLKAGEYIETRKFILQK